MGVPSEPIPPGQQRQAGRSWADWITVAVAVLALVVSLVSFNHSRQAAKDANEAKKHEDAIKVGFWRQDYANPQVLHVINRNSFDLEDVTVRFKDGYFIKVGLVPSCQTWTLAGFDIPGEQPNSPYTLKFPARLDFKDQESPRNTWTITDKPPQRQKTPPSLPSDKDLTEQFRTHMVGPYFTGCAT
ncbi:hypothetical protein [Streptomyces boluensis]|uniref:Uncharacterized protein n=1 Tax=Streptomyces boluensis TaxID=1775135 RepID=A0A964UPN8_9ACTN|nr:hypothetical protein [Streptomyces boluensis]NBE50747.1 hypothetical protein [Streptomyces boluensis]